MPQAILVEWGAVRTKSLNPEDAPRTVLGSTLLLYQAILGITATYGRRFLDFVDIDPSNTWTTLYIMRSICRPSLCSSLPGSLGWYTRPAPSVLNLSRLLSAKANRYQSTTTSTTQHKYISAAEHQKYLAAQRLHRPVSPNLGIYKWQVHSVASALERNTGIVLSGCLYLFGAAYVAAPIFGWDLSSASLAASFTSWPLTAQYATKMVLGWTFVFHMINGAASLVASTGWTMQNKARFVRTGTLVFAASFVGTAALVAFT